MDNLHPKLPGFTQELTEILRTLGLDDLSLPVWSIRHTATRIYLDMAWHKNMAFPAKTWTKETGTKQHHTVQNTSVLDTKSVEASVDITKGPSKPKKEEITIHKET